MKCLEKSPERRFASAAELAEELTRFLEGQGVARYTWPERVEMFTTFPRSASLKVQKRALVEQLTKDAT